MRWTKLEYSVVFACLLMLRMLTSPGTSFAEDADRLRPYLRFGNGDVSSNWGVYDFWSASLGANVNINWGGELGIDYYERKFSYQGADLGEISSWNLVPQLRLRKPLLRDRLVPYLIAGGGVSFLQFKDEESLASRLGRRVDISGNTFTMTGGGGIDYFISDNVALNLEGKYYWQQPISGTVDGRKVNADISTPTFLAALRVYTDLNHPRPLADASEPSPSRGYIGFRLGGAVLTDDQMTNGVTLGSDHPSIGKVNQAPGLLFGWDFNRNWGAELAWDFMEYRVDYNGAAIGEYSMKLVIPQVRYRMPQAGGRWDPYLTAGVGVSYNEFNDRTGAGYGLPIDAQGFYPAASVGAGAEYFVNRNLSLLGDVGWVYLWNEKFKVDSFTGSRADTSAFLFHLGLRAYLF